MTLALTNRAEGVTADGRRSVDYTATFASDGSAADVTLATLGLNTVDEVWVKAKTSSGIVIDWTASDGTKIVLDPSTTGAHTIRVVGK